APARSSSFFDPRHGRTTWDRRDHVGSVRLPRAFVDLGWTTQKGRPDACEPWMTAPLNACAGAARLERPLLDVPSSRSRTSGPAPRSQPMQKLISVSLAVLLLACGGAGTDQAESADQSSAVTKTCSAETEAEIKACGDHVKEAIDMGKQCNIEMMTMHLNNALK